MLIAVARLLDAQLFIDRAELTLNSRGDYTILINALYSQISNMNKTVYQQWLCLGVVHQLLN